MSDEQKNLEVEDEEQKEMREARERLASRFGENARTGGKGTQRRKKKNVTKQNVNEDTKLLSAVKRFGVQSLNDIEEINFFKEDQSVLHFKRPGAQVSVKENLLVVSGKGENKELKDLMPDILKQVGPQQYPFLKDFAAKHEGKENEEKEDEDDVPELVGNFEEVPQ